MEYWDLLNNLYDMLYLKGVLIFSFNRNSHLSFKIKFCDYYARQQKKRENLLKTYNEDLLQANKTYDKHLKKVIYVALVFNII